MLQEGATTITPHYGATRMVALQVHARIARDLKWKIERQTNVTINNCTHSRCIVYSTDRYPKVRAGEQGNTERAAAVVGRLPTLSACRSSI